MAAIDSRRDRNGCPALPLRVVVVEDHPLYRFAIAQTLQRDDSVLLAGVAGDADEGLALAREHTPDLVLLDLHLPRRDGLSLLDQVLSFGEGPVTVARVREVLGLIPDELYGEMLRLVAERDAPAVFALVDRLTEAGADLGEFVSGAGETLRAVLVVGMGGEPEGLTDFDTH